MMPLTAPPDGPMSGTYDDSVISLGPFVLAPVGFLTSTERPLVAKSGEKTTMSPRASAADALASWRPSSASSTRPSPTASPPLPMSLVHAACPAEHSARGLRMALVHVLASKHWVVDIGVRSVTGRLRETTDWIAVPSSAGLDGSG